MAKQIGDNCIEGCFGNIVFYKLGENFYARMKSSLTGKRVKKDPAFKNTMEYAGLLAKASSIASAIYRELPERKKGRGTYRKLAGRVMHLLKEKKTADEIIHELSIVYKPTHSIAVKRQVCEQRRLFANAIIQEALSISYIESELRLVPAPG